MQHQDISHFLFVNQTPDCGHKAVWLETAFDS